MLVSAKGKLFRLNYDVDCITMRIFELIELIWLSKIPTTCLGVDLTTARFERLKCDSMK